MDRGRLCCDFSSYCYWILLKLLFVAVLRRWRLELIRYIARFYFHGAKIRRFVFDLSLRGGQLVFLVGEMVCTAFVIFPQRELATRKASKCPSSSPASVND